MIDFPHVDKDAKIVVAMSGGVDSSTTVALLQENGYKNIEGMTLILHENNLDKGIISKDQNVKKDCVQVAEKLGIKHHFIDIKDLFMNEIIDPFLSGYANGVSFNPCVKCNRVIKFGKLLEESKKLGAQILVTGHYIKWGIDSKGNGSIHRSKSEIRDQSYFLAQIRKEALNFIRFPLANYTKDLVRSEAARFSIHVAQKKSSSDLCFAGIGSYSEIVNKTGEVKKGNILDIEGNIIGQHEGIHSFTIGQRKGIKIGGSEQPLYVVKIDSDTSEVTIGTRDHLEVKEIVLTDVNWLGKQELKNSVKLLAKVRASQPLKEAELLPTSDNTAKIVFKEGVFGVANGQICAFYDEDRLLGGGYMIV